MDRNLFLMEEVNDEIVSKLIKSIIEINNEDNKKEKEVVDYKREPIKLYINTNGGSTLDGFALGDIMDKSKTPIYTIGVGKVFSAGLYIYLFGHKRYISKNSFLMYHQLSSANYYKKLKDIENETEFLNKINEVCVNETLNRTNINKIDLEEVHKTRKDWYITAKESIDLGISHEFYTNELEK